MIGLAWGPLRWEKGANEPVMVGLEKAMAGMGLSDVASRVIAVQA